MACMCMGPQRGEPLCPCAMRVARSHLGVAVFGQSSPWMEDAVSKEFRSIIVVGKSRGARLRQARKHVQVLLEKFSSVKGWPADAAIIDQDFWRETRDAIEKLSQCFHEANAFNTVMSDHILIDDVEYSLTEAGESSLSETHRNPVK